MLVGIFGNLMVLIVYLRKRLKCSSDYFILNLAFLDLLTCLIGVPVEIVDLRDPYMFYAPAACKLLRTVESFSNMGSTLTLMAIAMDRYKRICKLGERFSNQKAKRLCIGAILIGALTCWPAGVVFGKKTVDVGIPGANTADCSTADEMRNTIYPLLYYGLVMLYFIICVIFVLFVYVRISIFIRRGKSNQKKTTKPTAQHAPSLNLHSSNDGHTALSSVSGEEDVINRQVIEKKAVDISQGGRLVNTIKVTRTTTIFVAVTAAFILSYLPFLVVMVTRNIKKNFEDILSPSAEVKVIVDAWKNAAADVVTKLRQRTITPKRLEEINWRLNLQMAQSNKSKMKLPNAMFELKINDEDSEAKEKIRFEMTHDELYSFYNQVGGFEIHIYIKYMCIYFCM
uniref:COMM domain-containing protein 10 n=1 Tax=Magallana gigas TaxID=29159 RepID=K1Q7I2_MAGGI